MECTSVPGKHGGIKPVAFCLSKLTPWFGNDLDMLLLVYLIA